MTPVTKTLVLTSAASCSDASTTPHGEHVVAVSEPLQFLQHFMRGSFDRVVVDLPPAQATASPAGHLLINLACTHSILDRAPDGIAVLDKNSQIVWANQRVSEWFENPNLAGMGFYDALGKPEIHGPDIHPLITAINKKVITRAMLAKNDRYFRLQVAPILENSGDVEHLIVTIADSTETTKQRLKMQALHEAELALTSLTTQEIFDMDVESRIELLKYNILKHTRDLLNFDVIEIRLLDSKTGLLVPLLSEGIDSEVSKRDLYPRAEGNGVTGFVVATGHSYLCEDTRNDPLYLDGLVGAKSSLTVPLKFNNKIIGSFNVESPDVNAFTDSDLEFLESFARGVAASLNTLELLDAQRTTATHQSIEKIHGAVVINIDQILMDAALVIENYIGHDMEVTKRLQRVLKNAREIKTNIQKVGENMVPADDIPQTIVSRQSSLLKGKRILMIDADEQVRTVAHQFLERQGCIVETAEFGFEAISMIKNLDPELSYDAIIADIRLADISGFEMLMKLRELLEKPPLVLMTGFGYDVKHSIVNARKAGLRPEAVLYKPFRLDQLVETVELTIKAHQVNTADSLG